jgi:hypothetical protein
LKRPKTKLPDPAAKVPSGTVNWKDVVKLGTTKSSAVAPSEGYNSRVSEPGAIVFLQHLSVIDISHFW